jgi:hypothetical protein
MVTSVKVEKGPPGSICGTITPLSYITDHGLQQADSHFSEHVRVTLSPCCNSCSFPHVFFKLRHKWKCQPLDRSPQCANFHHLGHWHVVRRLSYPRLSLVCDPCPDPTYPIRVRLSCLVLFLSLTNWHRFAKYLGSGVIIATAFIHLLPPAINELTSLCLGIAWNTHVRIYPAIFFPIIPILICFRTVALPPNAHFSNVLHDLFFWNPCLPHWHGQAHEAWYSLWYAGHDFGLLPFPGNHPSLFSCLGTNLLSSPT